MCTVWHCLRTWSWTLPESTLDALAHNTASWFISLCLINNWYYLKLFMVKIVHCNLNNYNNNKKKLLDMSSTRHKTSLRKIIQDFNLILNKDDNLTGRTGNNKDLDGWRKCNSQQLPHPCVELQILKVTLNLSFCHEFKCTFSTFNDV